METDVSYSRRRSELPMVLSVPDYSSTDRSLLDISTEKFHAVSSPCFPDAECRFSKGGWLLMAPVVGKKIVPGKCRFSLFLVNPVSSVMIELPSIDGYYVGGPCTFSLNSTGTPDCIIYVESKRNCHVYYGKRTHSCSVKIWVICPGDEAWEEHPIEGNGDMTVDFVALVGTHALCIHRRSERMVIYNLLERTSEFLSQLKKEKGLYVYFFESEGVVMKVSCFMPLFSSFTFMRFDEWERDWVEMQEAELENTSWFLGQRPLREALMKRGGEGTKVYTLVPNEYGGPNLPDYNTARLTRKLPALVLDKDKEMNVYIHNIINGASSCYTVKSLLRDPFLAKDIQWVDVDGAVLEAEPCPARSCGFSFACTHLGLLVI